MVFEALVEKDEMSIRAETRRSGKSLPCFRSDLHSVGKLTATIIYTAAERVAGAWRLTLRFLTGG